GGTWASRSVVALKYREAASQSQMSMLKAAIAMQLGGRKTFTQVRDPFGEGPFDLRTTAAGYVLTSKLIIDGKPFTMTFGKAALPEIDAKPRMLIYRPEADAPAEV